LEGKARSEQCQPSALFALPLTTSPASLFQPLPLPQPALKVALKIQEALEEVKDGSGVPQAMFRKMPAQIARELEPSATANNRLLVADVSAET